MAENHHNAGLEPPAGEETAAEQGSAASLPRERDLGRWGAAAVLILVVVGFFWKLTLTNQYTWLEGPDTAAQVLPWLQYQAGEWKAGRAPLWDPNSWMGQPLVGQAQPGVVSPLNWVLFALPLREGWIKQLHLHWYFVLIRLLGAWFGYLLARGLGCRRWSAVFGGLVFGLGGWLGATSWPQMTLGAIWTPLIFLYLMKARAAGRRGWTAAGLGGFFLGLAWLSGHHQIPIFVSLAAGCVWAWRIWQTRRWVLGTARAALFFALALGTAAVQILPAQEYGQLSVRWVGANEPLGWADKVPYKVHEFFGFQPFSLLGIVIPAQSVHVNAQLGVMGLGLALLGVALAWRRRWTRVLGAVGVGALLYSLANFAPVEGLFYALLPIVDKARSASMAIFVFGFAGSMLAARGLEELLQRRESEWTRAAVRGMVGLGVALLLIREGLVMGKGFPGEGDQRTMVVALVALLGALLLTGWRRGGMSGRALAAGALALALVELSNTAANGFAHVLDKEKMAMLTSMSAHADIAQFLKKQPGLRRVDIDDNVIQYNFGDWYGIQTTGGYLASVTRNLYSMELHKDAGKRLMGVEFLVAKAPTAFHNEEVFTGQSGLKVFRHQDVAERAFVVHDVYRLENPALKAQALTAHPEQVEKRAFVLGEAPKLESCEGPEPVRVASYRANEVVLEAGLNCRGMVVLADAYYPGWVGYVDGRKAQVHEVDTMVRGVVVEKGTHRIEYRYEPASVRGGAAVSLLSGLVALALAVWRRRSGGEVEDGALVGGHPEEIV